MPYIYNWVSKSADSPPAPSAPELALIQEGNDVLRSTDDQANSSQSNPFFCCSPKVKQLFMLKMMT